MNSIYLRGNISRDINLTFAKNGGMAIAKFNVAVARMKKDDSADFINCIAFSKSAELIADRLRKGSPILIEGHLQTGKYDAKDGHTVYTTDVIVNRFEFIGKKEDNNNTSNDNSGPDSGNVDGVSQDLDDGETPF